MTTSDHLYTNVHLFSSILVCLWLHVTSFEENAKTLNLRVLMEDQTSDPQGPSDRLCLWILPAPFCSIPTPSSAACLEPTDLQQLCDQLCNRHCFGSVLLPLAIRTYFVSQSPFSSVHRLCLHEILSSLNPLHCGNWRSQLDRPPLPGTAQKEWICNRDHFGPFVFLANIYWESPVFKDLGLQWWTRKAQSVPLCGSHPIGDREQ